MRPVGALNRSQSLYGFVRAGQHGAMACHSTHFGREGSVAAESMRLFTAAPWQAFVVDGETPSSRCRRRRVRTVEVIVRCWSSLSSSSSDFSSLCPARRTRTIYASLSGWPYNTPHVHALILYSRVCMGVWRVVTPSGM
uniref:Uncharacterized protein n=1 Tax=Plectus sambesii TaxID=2011161 RepID=A0A914UQ08_9BILA